MRKSAAQYLCLQIANLMLTVHILLLYNSLWVELHPKRLFFLLDKFSASGEEVNARDLTSMFAMESFGKFGFGIDINIFEESPESKLFHKMVQRNWDAGFNIV